MMLKPVAEHGIFSFKYHEYGTSVLGAPLLYFPAEKKTEWLVMAGFHGEEPEGVFLLSRILRSLKKPFPFTSVILAVNPDGLSLGTRGNVNGVDLNRNFPTQNWQAQKHFSRPILESEPEIELSAGNAAASEPETKYLIQLIESLSPKAVLSIHAPLACVDSKERSDAVVALEKIFSIPWVEDIGYETKGSFGTWCAEKAIPCITLELPRKSGEEIIRDFQSEFTEFLKSPPSCF
ncbi:MAG: murein tripeptide amidase MpaA [Fibrobacteraceae bacterium]|nr:murein tripeptide amidase MpaA [Fibrobacteraceae bacterium]